MNKVALVGFQLRGADIILFSTDNEFLVGNFLALQKKFDELNNLAVYSGAEFDTHDEWVEFHKKVNQLQQEVNSYIVDDDLQYEADDIVDMALNDVQIMTLQIPFCR